TEVATDYEKNTGTVIVETFRERHLDEMAIPGILVNGHGPFTWEQANAEAWKAMEEAYRTGKVKSIGVSNFHPHHLDALLKTA
ncbi:aldo/keto reductase, partial [Erysipelothrix rhusiopathiae]|nr:aldo/keto reductase [Erysipelothrix rhusiopathiae]